MSWKIQFPCSDGGYHRLDEYLVDTANTINIVDRELELDELRDEVLGREHSRSQSIKHIGHKYQKSQSNTRERYSMDSQELETSRKLPDGESSRHHSLSRASIDRPREIAADQSDKKPDISGAIFNLMNYVLGAGILALPYAFRQSGIILGTALVVLVSLATTLSFCLLLWSSQVSKSYGFEQLARSAYGNRLALFVKIIIIVDSFGALSAYMIVIGETVTLVFKSYLGAQSIWTNKFLILLIVTVFIILPLCALKNINYLGFTSALSLVPLVYLLVLQLVYLIQAGGPQPGILLFNGKFWFALPIVIFSFSSQQALFPLYTELRERNGTSKDIMTVVQWSIGLSSLCYIFSGMIGVMTYPTNAKGNVLNNFPSGVPVDILLATTAISIVFSFPVILWPARVSVDRLFFLDKEESYLRFILEAVGIVAISFLIAVAVPSFSTVLGLFGSLTNTTIGYVLPPLYYLKLDPSHWKSSNSKKAALALLILGGLGGLISAGIITEDYISSLIKGGSLEGE